VIDDGCGNLLNLHEEFGDSAAVWSVLHFVGHFHDLRERLDGSEP
jgi:hypothetical protein